MPEEKDRDQHEYDLASTMDEIVSDLERENTRLRAELELARSELLRSKKDAAAGFDSSVQGGRDPC